MMANCAHYTGFYVPIKAIIYEQCNDLLAFWTWIFGSTATGPEGNGCLTAELNVLGLKRLIFTANLENICHILRDTEAYGRGRNQADVIHVLP